MIQIRPDHRNNDQYQFVTGYTGGGAEMCVHLSFEEIKKRLQANYGVGNLSDDGEVLTFEINKETHD